MQRVLTILSLIVLLSASVGFAQSGHGLTGADTPAGQVEEEGGVYLPNAFTPNHDGVNDEYYITNANFPKFSFAVFDRWGNRVFSSTDPEFKWNGERDGDPVPSGTYVFILEATTQKGLAVKKSGTISIMR